MPLYCSRNKRLLLGLDIGQHIPTHICTAPVASDAPYVCDIINAGGTRFGSIVSQSKQQLLQQEVVWDCGTRNSREELCLTMLYYSIVNRGERYQPLFADGECGMPFRVIKNINTNLHINLYGAIRVHLCVLWRNVNPAHRGGPTAPVVCRKQNSPRSSSNPKLNEKLLKCQMQGLNSTLARRVGQRLAV